MKMLAWSVMLGAVLLLLVVVFRQKLGWRWLAPFSTHLIAAAVGLYLVDFAGLLGSVYIPLNPVTIGSVAVLGVPGLAMLVGLKITLFG
ncbi:pro-sigmaK processing inhibitor BofA [Paenibacillus spiritus]|uniref:Pro-sigmaK processing inhibitor BofA n=1 Tax=Paenibacillus spiritus TaxID=2496557 RepID=A0A5J5G964_9BACL|nr:MULTISPECIES: pro-sigmaK processing inhibitor BofA family protein [Paenibacillus]KAA9004626.1 pro-sigmaK processing inhibitor BofA [Paenibacillus spiritus]